MSISKILADKDLTNEDKLSRVKEIVETIRNAYGNTEVEIEDVKVNTTNGAIPFSHLEADSKVELLKNETANIKVAALSEVEMNPAIVLNKRVEEMVATNNYFANISTESDFEYL